ncbi:MAG: hypothetical protein OEZ68_04030 [Gammaproteobacteria bacterium]|nr:hypothetical protein [Gammaproteobacteria bacterium]MDH5799955.1 hypothetical protein [Gammaproteobacteria bacterium]
MPEDLPKAVLILLWLLSGFIVFGYLLMEFGWLISMGFAVVYNILPGFWLYKKSQSTPE